MKKNIPGKVLATVAASATPIAAADAVAENGYSQSAIDYRINVAFEGGVLFTDYQQDKVGLSDKLGETNGDMYGAVSVRRMYDTDLDWRLAAAFHLGASDDFDFFTNVPGSGSISFNSGQDYNFQTLDFDLGKHIRLRETDVRLFAGLRGLHVHEGFDAGFNLVPADPLADKAGTVDKMGSTNFWGVGPRIGAEAHHNVRGNWGVTGALSASAMWGRRHQEASFEAHFFDPLPAPTNTDIVFNQSQSSYEVVTNLEAKAGVTWEFKPGKMITGGYRVDAWDNLLTQGETTSQTFHGPFLRLDVKM